MPRLTVRDLMTTGVFAVLPDDALTDLHRLMEGWRVRHAPVVDESKTVVGIVSQRDLLAKTLVGCEGVSAEDLARHLEGIRVQEVMSSWVDTVAPEDDLGDAARRIFDTKHGCLVVTDEHMRLQGILTESDFVRYFAEKRDRTQLRQGRRRAWLSGVGSGVLASVGGYIALGHREGGP